MMNINVMRKSMMSVRNVKKNMMNMIIARKNMMTVKNVKKKHDNCKDFSRKPTC